ncbi:MAG: hypothetical protein G3M78_00175 [Candidatus Nitrohelix vancouverensis]|uniref:Uncharacterized protein n=1 Tax=Candidatus Nitrohelix vancouverensis TaxID=2705534 RepID=A0A7T0C029_9BACT|nr:MAG: hypothetical protein G3M78_00175 [Candidatus Nitrohelix vancouverensis]
MIEFTHIKYGVAISLVAILFGIFMGLSFGCCEDMFKDKFKQDAQAALSTVYKGDKALADKVASKSWVYMKRAHLHSQTMGVIAIVFSILAAWLKFPRIQQLGISLLGGIGSLGYGVFWLLAGFLAPGMGSTGKAKNTVELIAQASAGSFFIAAVALFCLLAYRMFSKQPAVKVK